MLESKYNYKKVEENKYDFWKNEGLFECGDNGKKPFSIILPPPNITGNLHIGHAYDTALQDVIIRYKKLKGFDCLWLPGMDHAAIATESKVVKKLKDMQINKYELGRDRFLDECWKWKDEHASNIHNQWAKLGLSLDYSKERFTLDEYSTNAVIYAFKKMYEKGLIYRGEKIINWDPIAKTALSNEEVLYREEMGKLYYLKYFFENKKDYILVATTRPETIFGDTAVAVNPKDPKYKDIVGKKVYVPLTDRLVEVIADDAVLLDFGTGALKITPAHALEDFEIGQRHNLEIIKTINEDGTLNELTGKYNKLTILEARDEIVKDAEETGLLEKMEDYKHSVGHSERTDAYVEPYLSKQWFVKMEDLAHRVVENQKTSNKINFIPRRFEKILNNWMNDCHDWCISRQLWWGIRIPVYYKGPEIFIGAEAPDNSWVQDEDVLDTWFSSALWPFSTMGWPNNDELYKRYFPTDTLVTGYDIIFFWVARMAFQSLEFTDAVPFKNCLMHGLIRDKEGKKMSKSKGNGVDPMEIIEKYGCDSMRYFLTTNGAPGMDLRFDEDKIKSTWNFINKIYNASLFTLTNIDNIKLTKIEESKLEIEEKWILTKFNETVKKVTLAMDKYRFNDAGSLIYEFTWDIFCDWYIELSKGRTTDNTVKNVLYKVLTGIIKMLHPFIPFVTEEIYLNTPEHLKSIMLESYPTYNKKEIFDIKEFDSLITCIVEARAFKKEHNITKNSYSIIDTKKEYEHIVNAMLRINNDEGFDKTFCDICNFNSELLNIKYYVPSVNKESVKENLLKEKELLLISIDKRRKLLSNEKYTSNAPKNIVDMDREKLLNEEKRLEIIESSLKEL